MSVKMAEKSAILTDKKNIFLVANVIKKWYL